MTSFNYSDEGNHQMWLAAHQGGSYSRVSRIQRLFVGEGNIYAGIGSDTFRQDAQIAYNRSFPLGVQIFALDDTSGGSKISTIGIVEDEANGVGRYFFMRYDVDGSVLKPAAVEVYDSSYDNEVAAASKVEAWAPMLELQGYVELGMRVVNLGGGPGQTFLFYVVPLSGRNTRLNVVKMPDPGEGVSMDAPFSIGDFDFEVTDRIYVVPHENGRVFIYLGDSDRSQSRRTQVLGYEPLTNTVFMTPTLVATDQVPFPMSYACCVGRKTYGELPIHLVLEPVSSWLQGAGSSIDDSPDTQNILPPSHRRSTGNAWKMTSIGPDGVIIEDSATFNSEDIRPWLGGAHADSQGGQSRVSAVPKMLSRIAPPSSDYEALESIPHTDSSNVFALQAKVVVAQEGDLAGTAFVYRYDDPMLAIKPAFGNNRGTSNVYDSSPPYEPQGSFEDRILTALLVPGTVLIEPQRSEPVGEVPSMRTVAPVAARLRSWDLQDDSAFYGIPQATFAVNAGVGDGPHDPSTDCLHGVQGDIFDPDLTLVVGWFTNGF